MVESLEEIGEAAARTLKKMGVAAFVVVLGLLAFAVIAAELTPAAVKDSASTPGGEVVVVRFHDPCAHPVILKMIEKVPPQYHGKFKAGVGMFEGKPYRHCWIEEYGVVAILWEDETMTQFPARIFKKHGEAS